MFSSRKWVLAVAAILSLFANRPSYADDKDPASLVPDSTILYFHIADPGAILDTVLQPDVMDKLNAIQKVTKYYESESFRRFREGVKLFEDKLGMDWQRSVRELVGGGVTFTHDSTTKSNVLFIRAKKADTLTRFNDAAIEVIDAEATKRGVDSPVKSAEHAGVTGWTFGKNEAHAIIGDLLVVSNKSDALKAVLDQSASGSGNTLAGNADFQAARKSTEPDAVAWGVVNLEKLRALPNVTRELSKKSDNPLVELILGSVIDAASRSPYVTAGVYPQGSGAKVRVQFPNGDGKVSESRKWHFPPAGEGAPQPLRPKGHVATLTLYRDLSGMWSSRDELFNENVNAGFTKAETNLGLYFQGKDFGTEVLGQLAPRSQLVVAKQEFPSTDPVPALRLPAFALVLEMKDEELAQSLQLTYQNIVGIINITGLQNGKPQLIITGEEVDGVTISKVKRVVPSGAEKENAPIEYNFAPACARVGKHFIIGSTGNLVRELVIGLKKDSKAASMGSGSDTMVLTISGEQLLTLFRDNRERIIGQNMLKEGQSREEAEKDVNQVFDLASHLKEFTLRLATGDKALTAELDVEVGSP